MLNIYNNFTQDLAEFCESFPSIREISQQDFSIDHDDLLISYLNTYKNTLISNQSHFIKCQNELKKHLEIEYNNLKNIIWSDGNGERIESTSESSLVFWTLLLARVAASNIG